MALRARHRRRRPRHAVAADLRRARVAVHRPVGDERVVRGRRRRSASSPLRPASLVDVVITRVMDLIMAVPSLVLAILVVAVLGPEPRQHHRRGDDRLSAALRAAGARLGARRADQGLRHRRARRRRRAAATDGRDRAAQLPRAADRAGGARRLRRHPRGGGPRLPRPRRAAADAGMGHDAGRRARVHPLRPLDRRAARPGDPRHGARDQPDRRRAARRARSQECGGARRWRCSKSATSPSPSPPVTATSSPSTASTSPSTATRCWRSSANPARASRWRCWR